MFGCRFRLRWWQFSIMASVMALTIFNKIFARQRIIAITILGTYLLLSWKELNVLFLCLCVLFVLMSDIADINSIIRGIDQATLAPPLHTYTVTQRHSGHSNVSQLSRVSDTMCDALGDKLLMSTLGMWRTSDVQLMRFNLRLEWGETGRTLCAGDNETWRGLITWFKCIIASFSSEHPGERLTTSSWEISAEKCPARTIFMATDFIHVLIWSWQSSINKTMW